MAVNKVSWMVAAAGPFILMGSIAYVSRTNNSSWQSDEYGPAENRKLESYAPLVRLTFGKHDQQVDREGIVPSAKKWLESGRRGDLQDVLPGCTTDQGETGIKGQVEDEKRWIVLSLIRLSNVSRHEGRFDESAQLLADAAEISDINKFSGALAISNGCMMQYEALTHLLDLKSKISPEKRKSISLQLANLRTPAMPLKPIVNRMARHKMMENLRDGDYNAGAAISAAINKLASIGPSDMTAGSKVSERQLSISAFTDMRKLMLAAMKDYGIYLDSLKAAKTALKAN